MVVELLEFDILGTPHTLYVTDDRAKLDAVETTVSSGTLAAATYSCVTTDVHLNSKLSPGAAVRSFFHEVYELTLATLSFTHDPYHPHDSFSALSDVVFGVFKTNYRLLFQEVLADAFRECKEKHFAVGVDRGPGPSIPKRIFHIGSFILTMDELEYYTEQLFPGYAALSQKEVARIVKVVSQLVNERDGVWEEDVKAAVQQTVSIRDTEGISGVPDMSSAAEILYPAISGDDISMIIGIVRGLTGCSYEQARTFGKIGMTLEQTEVALYNLWNSVHAGGDEATC